MTRKLPIFILLVLFLQGLPALAQSVDPVWVARYNGPGDTTDIARSINVDASGNVYVTGESNGGGTLNDYTTIKYYPDGDTAWLRRYNGPGNEEDNPSAVAVDGSGNVLVTGSSYGSGTNYDYATIKYDPDGDTVWIRRYNGPGNSADYAYDLEVDDSNYVYVTGYSYASGTAGDCATIKYQPDGDTVWVRRYDGPGNSNDWGYALSVDNSYNVYVTGYGWNSGTSNDFITIKYYQNGDTAWSRIYNGPASQSDNARDIAVDDFGNVYVTGESNGIGTSIDYATVKYDSSGNELWAKRYNGPGNSTDNPYAIAVDGSNNICVTGYSDGSGTSRDYATIKYYSNGDTAWVRRYNGTDNGGDRAYAMAVDEFDNVFVTGYSSGGPGLSNLDYVTIKYYPNGDIAWVRSYNETGDTTDVARAIAVDGSGNVYVTGQSIGSGTADDFATIKYVEYECGDANGDGHVSVSDVVYVMEYIFGGDAPDPLLRGNADGCGNVNVADAVYISEYLFRGGPAPSNCSDTSDWCSQVIAGNTVMVGCPPSVYPGGDSVAIPIYISNIDPLGGITLGFHYPSDNIEITSVDTTGTVIPWVPSRFPLLKPGSNQVLVGGWYPTDSEAPQTGALLITLNARILSGSPNQSIDLDSAFVTPAGEFIFAPAGGGVIHPAFSKCVRNDTSSYIAYSPVDLIITDPAEDSIGIDFNTIPGAVYDTTDDINNDGETDDKVIIPNPLVGDYLVRVVEEPGSGGGTYTLSVKLNGNDETPLVLNGTAPGPGEVDSVFYPVTEYLRGDPNRDGSKSISDVIFIINYLFKGGETPEPLFLGDANCDESVSVADVVYLVNYLFKGGDAPCS